MSEPHICIYPDCSNHVYAPFNASFCILHCPKDAEYWKFQDSNNVKNFWIKIRTLVREQEEDSTCNRLTFSSFIFPVMEKSYVKSDDGKNIVVSDSNFFYAGEESKFNKPVEFNKVTFMFTLNLKLICFEKDLNFSGCIFKQGIEVFNITVNNSKLYFSDCTFEALCYIVLLKSDTLLLYGGKYKYGIFINNSTINIILIESIYSYESFSIKDIKDLNHLEIEKATFNANSIVTLSNLHLDRLKLAEILNNTTLTKLTNINVNKQLILKNLNFNNTDFNGLDLEKAENIAIQNVSFLGSNFTDINWGIIDESRFKTAKGNESDYFPTHTIKRDLVRQLKYLSDSQADIINANKFYSLEMKLYNKSLSWKNFFNKSVFYFHNVSSGYSQNWFLSLFWIISITLLYSHIRAFMHQPNSEYFLIPLLINFNILYFALLKIILYRFISNIELIFILILSYFTYNITINDYDLSCFSNNLNPFSIMTGYDDLDLFGLGYKVIIAYLIYQLIISIRQNTRRK